MKAPSFPFRRRRPPAFLPLRERLVLRWTDLCAQQYPRPWLAHVALPLALIASVLAADYWAAPLLIALTWWWCEPEPEWCWIVACEAAWVGIVWALMGATALARFPDHRGTVACAWIGSALLITAISLFNRRHDVAGY